MYYTHLYGEIPKSTILLYIVFDITHAQKCAHLFILPDFDT